MVFSSSLFLLYFLPIFLLIYFLIDKKYKNGFGLFASLFFYAWGAPEFIFVVIGSIIIDFYLVRLMNDSVGRKKMVLIGLSVVLNVGLLLYYKYANFFVDNLNTLVQGLGYKEIPWLGVALPIGISFFTFQKLTYS
ncbi:MAG: MBOAT family protein, partial [Bacteroidales bacterium]|nr:MBOAT family protein [Bacteroidales bacterium]